MKRKALIVSLRGLKVTKLEKILLSKEKPWGVILFKRNLKSLNQIKKLTSKIKSLTGDNFCCKIYHQYINSLCKVLKKIGININTIPVLDVLRNNTSKVIGDRSFSKDRNIVKELGKLTIKSLHANKIAGIIKHIPGHGVAKTDSHKKMPIVNLNTERLNKTDFFTFKSSKAKLAMTAHILYSKIDSKNVATFSKKIIKNVIRKKIGFNGILISDDISMKALKYDLKTNAKKSIEAGCNLVLYCAGKTNDNFKLIKSLPYIDEFTSKKTSEFYKFLR